MIRREAVAWVALMASFVILASVTAFFRGPIAIELRRSSCSARVQEARALASRGASEAAGRAFAELEADYPEREEVLLAYADFLAGQARLDEAEKLYGRAAALPRQRLGSLRRYASFMDRRGKPDEATKAYEGYVKGHPADAGIRLELGLRLASERKFGDAEDHLRAAAENPSLRLDAETALSDVYARQGQIVKAADVWRRLVSASAAAQYQVYWQDIAAASENLEQWDKAAVAWRNFLKSFPNALQAAQRLSVALEKAGDISGAGQVKLLVKSLAPPIVLDTRLSDRLFVTGVSPLETNGARALDVHFRFTDTINDQRQCELRFMLLPKGAESGDPLFVVAEPETLGPLPLWRGDSVRQAFAIQLPDGMQRGAYGLYVALALDPSKRLLLSEVEIPPAKGVGQ